MKEKEIRNTDILDKYLKLVEKDVKTFFDFDSFVDVSCPACSGRDFNDEFKKNGFKYVSCRNCATLFVNPRPAFETLKKFYSDSPSTDFWVNDFFKPVADMRKEKIFKPRAEYINRVANNNKKMRVGDIGAGFGLFLEEYRKINPDNDYIAIEPSVKMAEICRNKNLSRRCAFLEELDGKNDRFDILTAFELIEHLFRPEDFLKKAYSLLDPKGRIFITTLNGKGFDILNLWERSKSVTPPHHLNFFNTDSIKLLLERTGFKIEEISTPGKLDWDIVENMIKREGIKVNRFWDLLAREGGEPSKRELQEWIVKNNLSSHMRVIAKKP